MVKVNLTTTVAEPVFHFLLNQLSIHTDSSVLPRFFFFFFPYLYSFACRFVQVIGDVSSSNGNPANIEISLAPKKGDLSDIPVVIEEGSKRLILTRKLDKEGPEGAHGLSVGVKCRKLTSPSEPSIIIPIRIIITDANDHAPEFIGTPYVANVSEVTLVGSYLLPPGTIRAVDDDQEGPFSSIEYFVEPGPFAHLVKFENTFGGNLILASPLDYESLPKFWVTIRAQDLGEPPNSATATVTINVMDADDQNPRFYDDKYIAFIPDSNRQGDKLNVTPNAIKAIDPDLGINSPISLSFSSSSDPRDLQYFTIDSKSGEVTLKKPIPSNYNLPITLVVRGTQIDNGDRYALTTLQIQFKRTLAKLPIKFIQSNYTVSLLENFPPGHLVLTLRTVRGDLKALSGSNRMSQPLEGDLKFSIEGDDGHNFEVKASGELWLVNALDYERKQWHNFKVKVTDGKSYDTTSINVTILNVNDHDPVFGQSLYNFVIPESKFNSNTSVITSSSSPSIKLNGPIVVGTVNATDNDLGDNISYSMKGPFARVFAIDNNGTLYLRSLDIVNATTTAHLIVVATDSGLPPRSSSVPVTVSLPPLVQLSKLLSIDGLFKTIDLTTISNSDNNEQPIYSDVPYIESSVSNGIPRDRKERKHDEDGSLVGSRLPNKEMDVLFSASSSSAIVLVIVLGVLLATLFIIIITLTVHVLKQRKFTNQSSNESNGSISPINPYTPYYATTSRRSSSTTGLPVFSSSKSRVSPYHHGSNGSSDNGDDDLAFTTSSVTSPPIVNGSAASGARSGVENPIFNLTTTSSTTTASSQHGNGNNNLNSRYFNGGALIHKSGPGQFDDGTTNLLSDSPSHPSEQPRGLDETMTQDELIDVRGSRTSNESSSNGSIASSPAPQMQLQSSNVPSAVSTVVTCTTIGPSITSSSCLNSNVTSVIGPSRISVVKWPQGSIPRRVKKLTWEDEIGNVNDTHHQSEGNLPSSVSALNGGNNGDNYTSHDHHHQQQHHHNHHQQQQNHHQEQVVVTSNNLSTQPTVINSSSSNNGNSANVTGTNCAIATATSGSKSITHTTGLGGTLSDNHHNSKGNSVVTCVSSSSPTPRVGIAPPSSSSSSSGPSLDSHLKNSHRTLTTSGLPDLTVYF